MRRTRLDDRPCPVARVTDLVGDWWTPLVLWELCLGRTRFSELESAIGCSRSILTQRLNRLVDERMVQRIPYETHPPRHDYRLTPKGEEFHSVLLAMWRWGSDWSFDDGRPAYALVGHGGVEVRPVVINEVTGKPVDRVDLRRTARPS